MVLEAYDRLQIRGPAITIEHLISARRSANLVFSRWSNRGANLWKITLSSVNLIQGTGTYTLPASTIMVMDAYLTQYQLNSPVSFTPAFTTTASSALVTVTQSNHGFSVNNWVSVIVPVSVGGIVIQGFYQVTSVLSSSQYTLTAATAATSPVTAGGAVPSFVTTSSSTTVTVTLANHGYLSGQTFPIQVSTSVGGIVLQGDYTIATVTSANVFTIAVPSAAGFAQTVLENGGQAQVAGQNASADPLDRIMYPISRSDYAALPDKVSQSVPTTFWFDRLTTPTVTVWQVPDGNGPYVLHLYTQTTLQDVGLTYGQNLDMPPRFFEAACAEVAAHLSIKWRPDRTTDLMAMAKDAWAEAASEDRERVTFTIMPVMDGYFD